MIEPDPAAAPARVPSALAETWRAAERFSFLQRNGARLRYARWTGRGPTVRGSVVLQQGRAEFIEKYATECVGELLERGFSVYAMDWRGQGLSDRPLPDGGKGHIDDFGTYLADFRAFLRTVVVPETPRPILALCHSMGSHLVLRHIAEITESPFSAAICVSPMTALHRDKTIRALVNALSPFGARDTAYMVATGPYTPEHRKFPTNDVTSDEWRYRFTDEWFAADPRLALGGPTLGWLRQAFHSMDRQSAPGMLERITVPVMVVSASADRVVDPRSHRSIVTRMRNAELVTIEGAKHEIMMETDDIRTAFWRSFDRFVATRI